jgi:hypothetical protein
MPHQEMVLGLTHKSIRNVSLTGVDSLRGDAGAIDIPRRHRGHGEIRV